MRHTTWTRSGRWEPNTPEVSPILWSKPSPSGAPFELDITTPRTYLHHGSELGEFCLSRDAVIPRFWRARELEHIINQIPETDIEAFRRASRPQ